MESNQPAPKNIDEYIARFSPDVQEILQALRAAIREAAPKAEETIGYQMPAFEQEGVLVYFAARKQHIGFYPTSSGIEHFKRELSAYKSSKGAVQFPLGQPLPLELIRKIVAFRVQENLAKAQARRSKGKA